MLQADRDRMYFGGNRELAIKRDGEKCVKCGMTREEHQRIFGRDITVDHIDRTGSKTAYQAKNNSLENLQTLCANCHGSKDNQFKRLTWMQAINIRHIGYILSAAKIAKLYGVTGGTVNSIRLNDIWKVENIRESDLLAEPEKRNTPPLPKVPCPECGLDYYRLGMPQHINSDRCIENQMLKEAL